LQDKFGELVSQIARYQRVRILAPENMHMGIRLSVADNEGDLSQVDLYNYTTNDMWMRRPRSDLHQAQRNRQGGRL